MNDAIGVENLQAAQATTVKKAEKLQGELAMKLIDGATQAPRVAADQLGRFPPAAPVQAEPREGSTIHVVA
jgi:hypothetical protein